MGKIKILSENVSNRIAAGEVIERPFSVVKELVENSIDAGATQIVVNIVNGGKDLIQVIDNGKGMSEDDAQLAFERHATSKISNVEDIIHVNSLGFRGEAIPSIASVSHFTLITKTEDADTATEISYDSGRLLMIKQTSAVTGTQITVKKLFMRIPARRKFLKTEPVEFKHILNYMHYQSVLYPNISFILTNNGRERFNYPAVETIDQRLLDIFGTGFSKINFLRIEKAWNSIKMMAYIELIENTEKRIEDIRYLFVNGRYIKDKTVFAALRSALEPFLKKYNHFQMGNLPMHILFLDIEPELVDVNVHPAKREIRLAFSKKLLGSIYNSIQETLVDFELLKQAELFKHNSLLETNKHELVNSISNDEDMVVNLDNKKLDCLIDKEESPINKDFYTKDLLKKHQQVETKLEDDGVIRAIITDKNIHGQSQAEYPQPSLFKQNDNISYRVIGQVFNTYLIIEASDKVLYIDQHAAHERILFDKYNNEIQNNIVASQQMLIPFLYECTINEHDVLMKEKENLMQLGFEIESLGINTIKVTSIPSVFTEKVNLNKLFNDIISLSLHVSGLDNFSLSKLIRDKVASIACKAAIKGNLNLSDESIKYIIEYFFSEGMPLQCPHGRPTVISFDKYDIEKEFKRKT